MARPKLRHEVTAALRRVWRFRSSETNRGIFLMQCSRSNISNLWNGVHEQRRGGAYGLVPSLTPSHHVQELADTVQGNAPRLLSLYAADTIVE